MLNYLHLFLLVTFVTAAVSETCVKYDFENDFESLFSKNSTACALFSTWQIENYSNIIIRRPNDESTKFMSPMRVKLENDWQLLSNCIRSFEFTMAAGGTVEVMFYIEAVSQRDILYVSASKIVPGGNDMDVGFARYSMTNSDFKNGWNILKLEIGGNDEQFDGYVYFFGTVTDEAIILVDSFRYIGPNEAGESCILDLDIETWTEDPITTTDSNTAVEEHCTVYDFETDFDTLFNNETDNCRGSYKWRSLNYANINIQSPHVKSTTLITPTYVFNDISSQIFSSCISSFEFNMVKDGILEIKFYMEANSFDDMFIIIVRQITFSGIHETVGYTMYSRFHEEYSAGWKTLRVNVHSTSDQFDGYVSLIGAVADRSVLIVDSFRYIGSTTNDENCVVYIDEETTTYNPTTSNPTTEDPTTVTQSTNVPEVTTVATTNKPELSTQTTTAEPGLTPTNVPELITETTTNGPESTTRTTTDTPTTITTPVVEDDICVTYDFEDSFESLFNQDSHLCAGFSMWHLGNYSSIDMNGVDASSDLFLTPSDHLSCIASFPFSMSPRGVIEVNVYMEQVSNADYLSVLAKIIVPNGVHTLAGMNMYNPSSPAFVRGWNVLRFSLASLTDFNGYLVFLGAAGGKGIVLVDSFRYIPPTVFSDHESCAIY